jgi:hypothetical protein
VIENYLHVSNSPNGLDFPHEDNQMQDHYRVNTTYSSIIDTASHINCLFAPNLCNNKHLYDNLSCLRKWRQRPPPPVPCNIRKIVLQLKKLNPERMCLCGNLPPGLPAWT